MSSLRKRRAGAAPMTARTGQLDPRLLRVARNVHVAPPYFEDGQDRDLLCGRYCFVNMEPVRI
jgi:hypothetical protein